jgi:hypothetical protein
MNQFVRVWKQLCRACVFQEKEKQKQMHVPCCITAWLLHANSVRLQKRYLRHANRIGVIGVRLVFCLYPLVTNDGWDSSKTTSFWFNSTLLKPSTPSFQPVSA